jgi:arylsulfatase
VNAASAPFDTDQWELYQIEKDFSQSENVAAANPAKLRELQDLFFAEAAKYNVLPLDDRFSERLDVTLRPSFFTGRQSVTFYPGMIRLPEGSAPKTTSCNHSVTVTAEVPKDGAEGVLVCVGGDTAGWSLCVEGGKLTYHYNFFDTERIKVEATSPLPAGKVEIRMDFTHGGKGPGGPAAVSLHVNGNKVGEGKHARQVPFRFGVETLDVGMDTLSPVSNSYKAKLPFAFNGKIEKVVLDLK